jgi:hypothetical protein
MQPTLDDLCVELTYPACDTVRRLTSSPSEHLHSKGVGYS